MILKPDSYTFIQGYKHDGSVHRTWTKAYVLEVSKERMVLITNHSLVVEGDGRKWVTREPAVCFFYFKRWYNVIAMIRNTGVHYYVNVASPALYDGEAIKYIDYDLDVKISPKRKINILDREEYRNHATKMGYSLALTNVLEATLDKILDEISAFKSPFDVGEIQELYQQYLNIKKR